MIIADVGDAAAVEQDRAIGVDSSLGIILVPLTADVVRETRHVMGGFSGEKIVETMAGMFNGEVSDGGGAAHPVPRWRGRQHGPIAGLGEDASESEGGRIFAVRREEPRQEQRRPRLVA